MKNILTRISIAGLLVVTIALAITQPPQKFYPVLDIEAPNTTDTITLRFLFDPLATEAECEALTGNVTRKTLAQCPTCRISKLSCKTNLSVEHQKLLGEAPVSLASGRTGNGVIIFQGATPDIGLATCLNAELQSANSTNLIKCYPADTPRPKLPNPSPMTIWSLVLFGAALFSSWLVGWFIVRYEHLHAHFSHDHTDSGPQKYHTQPTPRIGGLTVMAGLLAAGGVMLYADSVTIERPFGLLILAALPAFLGGLIEDVTKRVGVLERLLLTMSSGAAAAWLLGAILNRLDIPGIDEALQWLPLAIVLTAFAVGGIANATNIIDGYNGLAGGFSVIVLTAMGYTALRVGDAMVFHSAIALAAAIIGFLIWNWPRGKIFFGDGGAYLVGFMLAELAVLLVLRNPSVSPWFPLLLLIYPIFETVFSIYRRKFKNKLSPGQPDNQHLHQLIHDKLIPHQPHGKRFSRNSKVAKYLWIPTGVLAVAGSLFSGSTPILASAALGFCVLYVMSYRRIVMKSFEKHAVAGTLETKVESIQSFT